MNKYLKLVTFSHTIFAMPFALIGFFLATGFHNYPFSWAKLLVVIICMVLARNAAMGFNRYADRQMDAINPRTLGREIPSGKIKARNALIFSISNAALFIVATWFLNPLCFFLSPVALAVVLGYSYTKRFTSWCHLVLGLGLAIAPTGAYLAVTGSFHWIPLLISGLVLTWVSGFDIIYALQDEKFDRMENLYSIPAAVGPANALWISAGLHLLSSFLIVVIGLAGDFGWIYWAGSFIFLLLLTYQHLIVKPGDLSRVNMAFGTTNGIASVIYAAFFISSIFLS